MFQIIAGTTQKISEIMGNALHQKQALLGPLITKTPLDAKTFPKMLHRAFQSPHMNTTHPPRVLLQKF